MKIFLTGLVFFHLFSFSAWADSDTTYPHAKPKADLRVNAGWAAGFGPEFFGSSTLEFKHRPIFDLKYKDRLRIFGPKVTYALYKNAGISAGPLVHYSFGRNESDNPILKGLGDNGGRVEIGAFLNYKKGPFQVRAEGKSGLGDNAGEALTLSIMQGLYRGEKISWLVVLSARFSSQQTMQRKFGITEQQSLASVANLPAFRPAGGLSNGNIILFGEYKLKEHLSLMLVGSFWQLMSDAKNSPLVKSGLGSDFQSLFGTALIYKF